MALMERVRITGLGIKMNIRLYQKNGYRIIDRRPAYKGLIFVYLEKTEHSHPLKNGKKAKNRLIIVSEKSKNGVNPFKMT